MCSCVSLSIATYVSKTLRSSEMSLNIYQTTRRNIPEDWNLLFSAVYIFYDFTYSVGTVTNELPGAETYLESQISPRFT